MCYGCPGPQGGAHSTGTGPVHEPAVGSLPAAESTEFICEDIQWTAHPVRA